MLLACKYEEVSVPVVEDLILICNRAYSREDILDMERMIVDRLEFNMSVPTPYCFMRRFLKAAGSDKKLELLSFLIELSLVDYKMLKFQLSMLAAAAIYTAQCTLHGLCPGTSAVSFTPNTLNNSSWNAAGNTPLSTCTMDAWYRCLLLTAEDVLACPTCKHTFDDEGGEQS